MTGSRRPGTPPSPSRGRRVRRTLVRTGALVAALALVLAGCAGGPGDDAGRMVSGGTLEVARGETWAAASVGQVVRVGERIRTGATEARLDLGGGEVWLAPMSMVVVGDDEVDVVRGDVLVTSDGGLAASWADITVAGAATYRLIPGVSPVLKVYDGEVAIERLAEDRRVPKLRQIALGQPRLPADVAPLDYNPDDDWDRLLLARAVAFDAEAERLARGIDRQHGSAPQGAAFYETFAALDASTVPLLASTSRLRLGDDRFGPPSDALLTLFVAEAAVAHNGGDVQETARAIAELRSAGARWGSVAMEHGISATELARVVDRGQARRVAVLAGTVPEDGEEPVDRWERDDEEVVAASADAGASAPDVLVPAAPAAAAVGGGGTPTGGATGSAGSTGGASGGGSGGGSTTGPGVGGTAPSAGTTGPGSGSGGGSGPSDGSGSGGSSGSSGGAPSTGSPSSPSLPRPAPAQPSLPVPVPLPPAPVLPVPPPTANPVPQPTAAPTPRAPTPPPPPQGSDEGDTADDLIEDVVGIIGGF